ncbi:uncharacterized protein CXorf67-like [Tupaia chinensis]|uniref:uncharacterized protein CXorf67-like n=1 Tax=Tupaia chinensis TaxID=246437 RepID=UPI0007043C8D|nr:uncharacterized protein CXorf67-like [Tupaia chinensis]
MASWSQWQKELKHLQGEGTGGPKNKAAPAPGAAHETGLHDPVASSKVSPSSSGALHSSTACSSSAAEVAASAAISFSAGGGWQKELKHLQGEGTGGPKNKAAPAPGAAHETGLHDPVASKDAGLPSMQAKRRSHRQGSRSPAGQPLKGSGQAGGKPAQTQGGHPAQTQSPTSNRRRKQPNRKQAVQAQKPSERRLVPGAPRSQCSGPVLPSSPGSQAHSRLRRRHLQVNRWSHASGAGPAPRSHACEPAAGPPPRPALRSESPPGPALHSRAIQPGPALRSRQSPPGPALRSRQPPPGPPLRSRATPPGPGLPSHESQPGPALRSGASGPGPALRSRTTPSGRAGPSRTTPSGPGIPSGTARSGPILRRCATQRRSAFPSRHSLAGPTDENPSRGPYLRKLVFGSSSSSPDPEAPNHAPQPVWHAVRMRASSPSPPGRFFPFPQQSGESSSSSSPLPSPPSSPKSSGPSLSSSPSRGSGQSSSSSSPKFFGLSSIPTPSPASLRRALLPELYAQNPASPGEQDGIGSMLSPSTLPKM